jgi:hypothetical protein
MIISTETKPKTTNLYEQDFYEWIETTVKLLQEKNYQEIDWENLIEEVACLGRSERHKLSSLLTVLWEHILKLAYWEREREYNANHWQREIRNFRIQIRKTLKDSPSLKNYAQEIYLECYQDACKLFSDRSQISLKTFPSEPIATVEQLLDEDWFPNY